MSEIPKNKKNKREKYGSGEGTSELTTGLYEEVPR